MTQMKAGFLDDFALPRSTGRAPGLSAHPRRLRIEGGRSLSGTLAVKGSKNAVTKQMVASLLTAEPCVLTNVPRNGEVAATLSMLATVGTHSRWLDEETVLLHTPRLAQSAVSRLHAAYSRVPILMLSVLLHRTGLARIPSVGGCPLGKRPVDFHLHALQAMGASITLDEGHYVAKAPKLRGARLSLPFPSVGATECVLLAACLAEGETELIGAAVEPEVLDTVRMLTGMGAKISVDVACRTMQIQGVPSLAGGTHRVLADRTEVASFAAAALLTGGHLTIQGAAAQDLSSFLEVFTALGGVYQTDQDALSFGRSAMALQAVQVETGPHPGFMTDWQPLVAIAATQAVGESTIHETVFENRLSYLAPLKRMGARLEVFSDCPATSASQCRFRGANAEHFCRIAPGSLNAANLTIPDLRAGFAYILAGLAAQGITYLENIELVERGYTDLVAQLQRVGAAIESL